MNRRRFLIALAVVLPLAFFGAAKVATRWRPIKLGHVELRGAQPVHQIEASDRYIVLKNYFAAGDVISEERTLFDLASGKSRPIFDNQGIADKGAWLWELQTDQSKPQLLLREGGKPPESYDLNVEARHATRFDVTLLRVRPALNRVELLLRQRLYRWNKTSRQLEHTVKFGYEFGEGTTLSRDGKTVIDVNSLSKTVYIGDTRTGRLTRRVSVAGIKHNNSARIMPFGEFVLYHAGSSNWQSLHWHIASASDGRVLWNFRQGFSSGDFVVAPDQKEIALLTSARNLWEIRDLATGQILRTLPLVPNAGSAAFSPDGTTLYSVADGVLYRQRAR